MGSGVGVGGIYSLILLVSPIYFLRLFVFASFSSFFRSGRMVGAGGGYMDGRDGAAWFRPLKLDALC